MADRLMQCAVLWILCVTIALAVGHTVALASPVLTQQQKLLASDAAPGDRFGRSVALSEDTMVVGADLCDEQTGCVYIFSWDGSNWVEQQKLVASDRVPNDADAFGSWVDLSGDTLVVGAHYDDGTHGSVYVFVRDETTWVEQQKLIANDRAGDPDWFGYHVAISGDTVVVGAHRDHAVGQHSGSAYVFKRSGTTWFQEQKLVGRDLPAHLDYFGGSVAVSGDTLVVGAQGDDDLCPGDIHCNSGAAYVFYREGTSWVEHQKLVASDPAPGDAFGGNVALDGDTLLISADGDDAPANGAGSAYVFVREGTDWVQQQKLFASDSATYTPGLYSVALWQDIAILGAHPTGSAYVFERVGTTWTEQQKLVASDHGNDWFGFPVAVFENTVLIGALFNDDDGPDSGSAYVFGPDFITVEIDVKPGSYPNCFNINGNGVIPVAILGSDDVDVADIDPNTLSFAGLDVRIRGNRGPLCSIEFVNDDAFPDMVCHFEDDTDNWDGGGDTADLSGGLFDGTRIEGTDSICVVP